MTVCVGCGLIEDAGIVSIDAASVWGGDGLVFPGSDTGGVPVYCDSAGQLRLPPTHTTGTYSNRVGGAVAAGFSASSVDGHHRSLTIANPSSVRACSYLVIVMCKLTVSVTTQNFAFRMNVAINGGSPVTRQAEYWGVPGTGYAIEQLMPEMFSGQLPAGESLNIEIIPGIDGSAGGAGTFTQQVVNADAIMRTRST